MNGLILPTELIREIAMHSDAKTILILWELYPDVLTDGFFIDYLIHNGYDVHIKQLNCNCICRYIKWTKDGFLHNEFGPALIYSDGREISHVHDKDRYDENGPRIMPEVCYNNLLYNKIKLCAGPGPTISRPGRNWYDM